MSATTLEVPGRFGNVVKIKVNVDDYGVSVYVDGADGDLDQVLVTRTLKNAERDKLVVRILRGCPEKPKEAVLVELKAPGAPLPESSLCPSIGAIFDPRTRKFEFHAFGAGFSHNAMKELGSFTLEEAAAAPPQ